MKRILFCAAIVMCAPLELGLSAKTQGTDFASCGWWQSSSDIGPLYKLGFAQGVVVGSASALLGEAQPKTPAESALTSAYKKGFVAIMSRPATMQEAFNSKCSDYRNRQVLLWDVAVLVTLEFGGIGPEKIEAALQVLRADGFVRARVIAALSGQGAER